MKNIARQQADNNDRDAALRGRRSFLRLAAGAGAASVGAVLLAACGGGGDADATSGTREGALTRVVNGCASKAAQIVDAAGSTVGYIDFVNDGTNAFIAVYSVDNANCLLGDLELWLGTDLALVPLDLAGLPRVAALPLQHSVDGAAPTYEFVVPLASLGLPAGALSCAATAPKVYLVGQVATSCATGMVRGYTGPNGAGTAFTYATFDLCCADTPVVLTGCETAFAKGGYVFTTDAKSNPQGLPTLGLNKNRWGWAINLRAAGTTTYPIYAGAGLNKISAGKQVGTLTVSWDGAQATVTYALVAGVAMSQAHLYAGDLAPTTIAPGQYGNTAYFTAPTRSHTFTVPVADRNGDGAWLIAHAVVCKAA